MDRWCCMPKGTLLYCAFHSSIIKYCRHCLHILQHGSAPLLVLISRARWLVAARCGILLDFHCCVSVHASVHVCAVCCVCVCVCVVMTECYEPTYQLKSGSKYATHIVHFLALNQLPEGHLYSAHGRGRGWLSCAEHGSLQWQHSRRMLCHCTSSVLCVLVYVYLYNMCLCVMCEW